METLQRALKKAPSKKGGGEPRAGDRKRETQPFNEAEKRKRSRGGEKTYDVIHEEGAEQDCSHDDAAKRQEGLRAQMLEAEGGKERERRREKRNLFLTFLHSPLSTCLPPTIPLSTRATSHSPP